MTPLELSILIHYKGHACDFQDGDFSAPAVRQAIDSFRDTLGLLVKVDETYRTYGLSERGETFVDYLCSLPLPVPTWVMPNAKVSGAGTASAGLPGYADDNNGEK